MKRIEIITLTGIEDNLFFFPDRPDYEIAEICKKELEETLNGKKDFFVFSNTVFGRVYLLNCKIKYYGWQ